MSYKISAKNRKVKKILQIIIKVFSLGGNGFPLHSKMIFFGTIIGILSLFMYWFEGKIKGTGFNSLLGLTGLLFIILYLEILFILFFTNLNEKIKYILKLNIKDPLLIIILGFFGFFININTIFIIKNIGLTFDSSMILGIKGIGLNIVGFIFIIIGGFLYNLSKKEIYIYTDNSNKDEVIDEIIKKDSNMKLPF